MRNRLPKFLVPATLAVLLTPAVAPAQVIIKDNSSPVYVDDVIEYKTDFNTVGGMLVSYTLTGPGSASGLLWGDISGVSGIAGAWGVWTSSFKLWGNGGTDTFGDNVWNFWGKNVSSFTLEAIPGNGVFDVVSSPDVTEGSSVGKKFNWAGSGPDSRVTYSNPVGVSPDAPLGDLYGTLKVEFGEYDKECPAGYSYKNGSCYKKVDPNCRRNCDYDQADPVQVWKPKSYTGDTEWVWDWDSCEWIKQAKFIKFSQDMDNVATLNPGTPEEVVPEPATMTLLATGLVGLAASRRRRKGARSA